ncbi:MAG: hypothetical protein QM656_03410 [Paracoccaceae bacterium]
MSLGPMICEEVAADDHAVDAFAMSMKAKMAAGRAKGRGGWRDPARCSIASLEAMFCDHLGKTNPGNYVDLAIIAMMIHLRQQWGGVAPAAPSASGNTDEG